MDSSRKLIIDAGM